MIDLFHKPILHAVKGQLPKITDAMHKEVEVLNNLLSINDPKSFMVPIFDPNYPLNLTMTRAPQLDSNTQIININFDGTFFDVPENTNHVDMNTLYPVRESGP